MIAAINQADFNYALEKGWAGYTDEGKPWLAGFGTEIVISCPVPQPPEGGE